MVAISEADALSENGVWDLLSASFGFPAWFGRNFAALEDLLEDIEGPAELEIVLDKEDSDCERRRFFSALATVAKRCARENPALHVEVRSV